MAVQPTTIAGAYSVTWGGADLGNTEDGFTIRVIPHYEEVRTDASGEAILNKINLGADIFIDFTWLEYNKMLAATPFAPQLTQTLAVPTNMVNKVSNKLLAFAKVLVMTPLVLGGNAAKVYTAYLAVPVSDVNLMLSSGFTRGGITFQCFPDDANASKTLSST